MNLIYAALFLHSANKEINEENLKKIVDATGESVDEAQIRSLVAALSNINIDEVIKKAVSIPTTQQTAPTKEEVKEGEKEEEVEKKVEEAAEGLSSLFG